MSIWAPWCVAACLAAAGSVAGPSRPRELHRYEASRMSMACLYAIEAYGPDLPALRRDTEAAFDEVDRIDRLMSHYKAESPVSRINRDAAAGPVNVDRELFDFIRTAVRYGDESAGAFDITVGPLMKTWGFFRGAGRVPAESELNAARQLVGASHLKLDPRNGSIGFDRPGVELDLGGIAKGYAVDRAAALLRQRKVVAALISAGGSSIYGLGAPPGRDAWEVAIQDPLHAQATALRVKVKDRSLSVAGRSEKSFEAGGVTYSHIMDPRTGRPVQGMLTVAVLAESATEGDALDDAFFVLGVDASTRYLTKLPDVETWFFLPAAPDHWTLVHRRGASM